LKDHWWWLQKEVWEGKEVTSVTNSPWRLFLEEDHCVSQDAYTFLKEMIKKYNANLGIPPQSSSKCFGVGLTPMMDRTPKINEAESDVVDYHWGVQNAGYAFPRESWQRIRKSEAEFNSFHDGWDVTLLHMMQTGLLPALMLLPRLSRMRNIGVVGVSNPAGKNWYKEIGFAEVSVSKGELRKMEDFKIGTRVLGKDPRELPYMGPFGSKYDFDAVRPGQLNNNWDGNYGPDVTTHWGFRGDWQPGQRYDDGWGAMFHSCVTLFIILNAAACIAAFWSGCFVHVHSRAE